MRAILIVNRLISHQTNPQLVHQSVRFQGVMAPLVMQKSGRDLAQFGIDSLCEPVARVAVALAGRSQPLGNLRRRLRSARHNYCYDTRKSSFTLSQARGSMATPRDRDILTQTGLVTPQRFAQVRAIFEAAVERPVTERRSFAAGACGGDTALLREVEAMLAAEAQPDPILDRNPDRNPPSSAPEEGRFPAGTVLAGRYRILGLLGQGGMGEVYKAFDMILNQTVALKFLAPALIGEAALVRFRNEVRIARQVSHPNVCRVYDLGMVDGLHFLSMEYLDGEDIKSLLRRIGRLPQDKAIEFTRKICAGLGAAHERGVLHRDLKPANIMIGGRGEVSITDFGLAAVAREIPLSDIRSGTPAYMSPEQKARRGITTRSDLYSLGLILHEMFTGKR